MKGVGYQKPLFYHLKAFMGKNKQDLQTYYGTDPGTILFTDQYFILKELKRQT